MSEAWRQTVAALAAILAVTAWRVLCLHWNRLDLFMDESQYWLWGQELAFGYFSKPPLIGWAIRAATEAGGSDAAFWVRLPGPLAHGVAAILVGYLARALWRRPEAVWAGPAFATLPGVAVLALFISTDDLLLPAVALALLAWVRLRAPPHRAGWAVALGVALGLGLMAKYAMVYLIAGIGLAAVLPGAKPPLGRLWIALPVALAILAPNVWWNLSNGFITLAHTAENAGWAGIAWNWSGAAEFLAVQALAFGPVLAVGFLLALPGAARRGETLILLASAGVFALVAAQALVRDANGNWAAPAFVAGTALTVPWLLATARAWAWAGIAINAAIALALPLAPAFPDKVRFGGRSVFFRAMGPAELSEAVLAAAKARGIGAVVADHRVVLSDLTYRAKGRDVAVYALPPDGLPGDHYQLTRPAPGDLGPALLVVQNLPPGCADLAEPVAGIAEDNPTRARHGLQIHRVAAACW